MNEEATNRAAWVVFFLLVFTVLSMTALFGWAIIELVNWITSR